MTLNPILTCSQLYNICMAIMASYLLTCRYEITCWLNWAVIEGKAHRSPDHAYLASEPMRLSRTI